MLFLLLGLLVAPFLWPDETSAIRNAVRPPTATATIAPVVDMISVDIPHVRSMSSEILVKVQDNVTKDQLLADLASYRAKLIASPPPISMVSINLTTLIQTRATMQ